MTDFFDTLLAASDAVHDQVYGETFLIEPRAAPIGQHGRPDPNARKIADPDRAATTFTGIWVQAHATVRPTNKTGHPAGESGVFGDDKPKLDFETSALPFEVRIGDLVTRQKTGERFAVSDPGDDGFTRSMISLTAGKGRQ